MFNETFYNSSNCNTDSSPQNVLTCNLAVGQEAIDLCLAELRNMGNSVAP